MHLLSLAQTNHALASVLATADDMWTRRESQRMRLCSHGLDGRRVSHCRSPLCILCNRWKNETENRKLRLRAEGLQVLYPAARWFFVGATLKDAATDTIRSAAKTLGAAWNGLTGRVRSLIGAFRTVEIASSEVDPDAENVHIHGLLAVGPGYSGRYRLNSQKWTAAWQEEAGGLARTIEVEKARNLDHVINYSLSWSCSGGGKGFATRAEKAIQDPQRYIERVRQLSGLHTRAYSGELASQPIRADGTGLFTGYRSQQWSTFEANLARQANRKSKRPLQLLPVASKLEIAHKCTD